MASEMVCSGIWSSHNIREEDREAPRVPTGWWSAQISHKLAGRIRVQQISKRQSTRPEGKTTYNTSPRSVNHQTTSGRPERVRKENRRKHPDGNDHTCAKARSATRQWAIQVPVTPVFRSNEWQNRQPSEPRIAAASNTIRERGCGGSLIDGMHQWRSWFRSWTSR